MTYGSIRDRLLAIPNLHTKTLGLNGNILKIISTDLLNDIMAGTANLKNVSLSERIYTIINQPGSCEICNTAVPFISYKKGYQRTCSRQCGAKLSETQIKRKATKKDRYGDENYNNITKIKATKKDRYGDENYNNAKTSSQTHIKKYGKHFSSTADFTRKIKNTNLLRYGDENYNNRDKALATNLIKFGVKYPIQLEHIKNKIKDTNLLRYGTASFAQSKILKESFLILQNAELFINYIKGKSVIDVAIGLHVDSNTVITYSRQYNGYHLFTKKSNLETKIKDCLEDLAIPYIQNSRKIIPPKELDFYLPDYKIAIEINGNYWHSELGGEKDKNYHFNKWKLCREQGIDLYSYFEDELLSSFNIIKSKLRYLTDQNTRIIGARKCIIQNITYKQESEFLVNYHIQKSSFARNKTIGAFYNNELVAVFSWQQKKNYLEITRFACNLQASYPGLFSKFEKYMIKELKYHGDIVSFSNNGHSNGNVYKASGYTTTQVLGPSYWYTKHYKERENRQKYMKSKIKKKFNLSQAEIDSKTEWQLMQEQGYDRIWDSGKIKWSKTI